MSYRPSPMNMSPMNRSRSTHIDADIPTAVSTLLASTRRLQDSLRKWSLSQMSENAVSDVYVTVGNDFHATVVAFHAYKIDMSDLASFPNELRAVLEQCLSEEASPRVYEFFITRVQQIIAKLLQGLRDRQKAYWEAKRLYQTGY